MKRLKAYLGLVPAALINRALKRNVSRAKMHSLVRFVSNHPNWFASVDRKIRTTTNFDFEIYCDRNETIGQTILLSGQWEGLVSRTISACLEPGDFAIDIGANMGYDTLLMSNAVGPTGTVLAFEPDFQNLIDLLCNVEAHKYKNIVVEGIALSSENSLTKMACAGGDNRGLSHLRLDESGSLQPVLTSRLDRLIGYQNFPRIAVVKMDIEGYEYRALEGLGALIDKVEYLTCEINHEFLQKCGGSAKMLFDHMQANGFVSYCAEPSSDGQWIKHDYAYVPTTASATHFDVLFCRKLNEKLRSLISDSE
jgi:FkbM family methyltransferase